MNTTIENIVINPTVADVPFRCEQANSFSIVKEINVSMLPEETRYALEQVYSLPMVFTRGEFLRKMGSLDRTFSRGVINPLLEIDVREYEYVALVEKSPAASSGRLLLEARAADWDLIRRNTENGAAAKTAAADKRKIKKAFGRIREFKNELR